MTAVHTAMIALGVNLAHYAGIASELVLQPPWLIVVCRIPLSKPLVNGKVRRMPYTFTLQKKHSVQWLGHWQELRHANKTQLIDTLISS